MIERAEAAWRWRCDVCGRASRPARPASRPRGWSEAGVPALVVASNGDDAVIDLCPACTDERPAAVRRYLEASAS